MDVTLPKIGDGIESGEVLEVLVAEGETLEKDQGLVELETDKATVEVPSSHSGRVTKVHVRVGDTVAVGATLVSLDVVGSKSEAADALEPNVSNQTPTPAAESARGPDTPVVSDSVARLSAIPEAPMEVADPPSAVPAPLPLAGSAQKTPVQQTVVTEAASAVAAGPAVRRFARDIGISVEDVVGTGLHGRITRDDVLAMVRRSSAEVAVTSGTDDLPTSEGPVHIEPTTRIRRTIADKMLTSWTTAPRVTNFDDADVTELERLRQASKADYLEKGVALTSMPFLIRACTMALQDHPTMNATIDMNVGEITYKQYYNIGIAVDTERGLLVPVLRNTDRHSIPDLSKALARISDETRRGDIAPDQLRGSTFTISNLGAIGGTYSTPIINVPEVAILLVGRSRKMPVVVDDNVHIRLMMPLSLSYDHRLVDGATAARFLNQVIGYLEAPGRLLLAM